MTQGAWAVGTRVAGASRGHTQMAQGPWSGKDFQPVTERERRHSSRAPRSGSPWAAMGRPGRGQVTSPVVERKCPAPVAAPEPL